MYACHPNHPASPRFASRRSAFTLIELLVVVAIIALLMSILTPSLSRARQQAKSTVCLTRLAEFMKGLLQYSHDNDYLLPPMRYTAMDDQEEPALHGWAESLYTYMYQDRAYDFERDFPVQRNHDNRYELWVCKEAIPMQNSTGHYRPYEYSWSRRSLDQIKARLPIITDANPNVTDPCDLLRSDIPMEHIAGLEGEAYIDERHYGGANYCFNDGHAVRSTNLKEELAEDWDLNPETLNEDTHGYVDDPNLP